MNPDLNKIERMEMELQQLRTLVDSLVTTIGTDPQYIRSIGEAITATSGKTAASATQAVNEAGAGTYDVMLAPDGFITIGDKNVPYIN